MDLQTLGGLGLPGWAITVTALVIILKQVGLLDFLISHLRSQSQLERDQIKFEQDQIEARTAAEESEYVALWSQMTQLQTKTLDQNELLLEHIIGNSADWHIKHSEKLFEVVERQYQIVSGLKELSSRFTLFIGEISDKGTSKTA